MKNTFIGTPMERREDLRFLRGRGEYVDDVAMPGLLYAVILRSPWRMAASFPSMPRRR